jgi:hypothetical protein
MPLGPPRPSLGAIALLSSLPLACFHELVPLVPAAGNEVEHVEGLEVVASIAGGSDPLPVRGAWPVYGGLTEALRASIETAAEPWAERHGALRPGGWQLLVEITRSDAELRAGRLTVEIETRVTLRGTIGQVHLGQTHGYCKVADTFAGDGAPVVTACLERLSRDLAGWLEGRAP